MGNSYAIYDNKCLDFLTDDVKDCPVYREHLKDVEFINHLGRVFEKFIYQNCGVLNLPDGDRISWFTLMGQSFKLAGEAMPPTDPFGKCIVSTGKAEQVIGEMENEFSIVCNRLVLQPIQEIRRYIQTVVRCHYLVFLDNQDKLRTLDYKNLLKNPSNPENCEILDIFKEEQTILRNLHVQLHNDVIYVHENVVNIKAMVPALLEQQLQYMATSRDYLDYVLHLFKSNNTIKKQLIPLKILKESFGKYIPDYRLALTEIPYTCRDEEQRPSPIMKDKKRVLMEGFSDDFLPKSRGKLTPMPTPSAGNTASTNIAQRTTPNYSTTDRMTTIPYTEDGIDKNLLHGYPLNEENVQRPMLYQQPDRVQKRNGCGSKKKRKPASAQSRPFIQQSPETEESEDRLLTPTSYSQPEPVQRQKASRPEKKRKPASAQPRQFLRQSPEPEESEDRVQTPTSYSQADSVQRRNASRPVNKQKPASAKKKKFRQQSPELEESVDHVQTTPSYSQPDRVPIPKGCGPEKKSRPVSNQPRPSKQPILQVEEPVDPVRLYSEPENENPVFETKSKSPEISKKQMSCGKKRKNATSVLVPSDAEEGPNIEETETPIEKNVDEATTNASPSYEDPRKPDDENVEQSKEERLGENEVQPADEKPKKEKIKRFSSCGKRQKTKEPKTPEEKKKRSNSCGKRKKDKEGKTDESEKKKKKGWGKKRGDKQSKSAEPTKDDKSKSSVHSLSIVENKKSPRETPY